uniref:Uncharacterized protein n=1 Tax=Plectus sambesii TaxID=2011161 RepID=A0A914VG33_9BILA
MLTTNANIHIDWSDMRLPNGACIQSNVLFPDLGSKFGGAKLRANIYRTQRYVIRVASGITAETNTIFCHLDAADFQGNSHFFVCTLLTYIHEKANAFAL